MSLFTTLVGGKLLIGALAVGSVAVGGTAAAAATGELPTALQQQAHSVFGAPAPKAETSTDTASTDATETDSTDATETDSTDATDATDTESTEPTDTQSADTTTTSVAAPAYAHGLCTAWSKGGLAVTSVAYTTLVTAAGGSSATDISTWCGPYLVAPGHAKHTSQQSDGTSDGSEPTSSHGQGHHATDGTGDSVSSDDQQGDDSATQQGDTGSGSDDQGDASTSTHGGSSSHGGGHSSGSDH